MDALPVRQGAPAFPNPQMKMSIPNLLPPQLPHVPPAPPAAVPQIPALPQVAGHEDPKYSKNYRPVTIDMLQSNNQFNIQTFFDL